MGQPGYIYVLRLWTNTDPLMCPYKIGRSKYPTVRQDQIGVKMPFDTTLILVMRVDDMDVAERNLHRQYGRWRLNGEWFQLTEETMSTLIQTAGGTGEQCVCWDYNPPCPFFHICKPTFLK